MKRIVLSVIILCLVTACAYLALPKNATDAERLKAKCTDARTAYDLSVVMLDSVISVNGQIYWRAYQRGAELFLAAYCGG